MREIWFINQYAIAPDLPGSTRHYDFGVELVKAGYSVRIFASNVNLSLRKHIRDLHGKLWLEEQIDGVLFEWVRTSTYQRNNWRRALNMFNFSWNVYLAGLRQGARPDLIVGSSPHLFAALAGYRLARRLNCAFIFEVRDLWPQALIDMNAFSAGHPMVCLMRYVEQQLYRNADHIIVLAEGSIPYLKQRGVIEEHISYIPNGVHPEHFISRRTREESRRLYGFERFTVVYTGAHGPANALHTILDAANELKEESAIEFILIGDGPSKLSLQAQAREMKLKNLRFMNPVPKNNIPDLLFAADAAVIALKDAKAFYKAVSPNKLYDYLASAKPVLCAVPGEVARMVERYECGLTSPPEDGQALAKQVCSLAAMSKEERNNMGARGQKLVLEQFSRPKLARRIIEVADNKI
ncbi:MAG: putative glycosyl transferase [Pelotomaculum sp. PtaB.Bin104]|nr:MAG: putative glycosyl transferase [Pelotomaculum sp. PtaB.Bin104]